MLDSFLVRAALAGVAVALAAAPLGCFVVWRRMAYFGDATAHAALLGVALSLAFSVSIFVGTLGVALVAALLVAALGERTHGADTLLGVLSHSALAFGLVAASFLPGVRGDLSSWLFGDILSVDRTDLAVIWLGALAVVALLGRRWQALLLATLNPDLAHASGVDPRREQLILAVALALVVAVAIQVVGALLIGALLIVPSAAARPLASTPERMAAIAVAIGAASAVGGLWAAWELDTPAGPSIVCVAALAFALTGAAGGLRARAGRARRGAAP